MAAAVTEASGGAGAGAPETEAASASGGGSIAPPVETRILAGAAIAAEQRERVKRDVAAFRRRHGFAPTLAILFVGRDAPSAVYLQQILRSCRSVGLSGRAVEIPGRITTTEVRRQIELLNEDPLVAGVIVQMPLPSRIPLRAVIDALDPAKDVDGIDPMNAGLLSLGYAGFIPATATAAVEILKRSGYVLEGLNAVVIGRSNVVGKPAAQLLLREHCTVTVCHRRTRDLAAHTRIADLVVVAAGSPGLVTGEMLKPGALVVDVGINVVGDRIVGDVDPSARGVAAALTPVPGGVGPLTNAILLEHVVQAARAQVGAGDRRPRHAL